MINGANSQEDYRGKDWLSCGNGAVLQASWGLGLPCPVAPGVRRAEICRPDAGCSTSTLIPSVRSFVSTGAGPTHRRGRESIRARSGQIERYDCEYYRHGTANLVVSALQPHAAPAAASLLDSCSQGRHLDGSSADLSFAV